MTGEFEWPRPNDLWNHGRVLLVARKADEAMKRGATAL